MTLSALAAAVAFEVVRDGEFAALGLLGDGSPGRLACLYDAGAARDLGAAEGVACVLARPDLADAVPAAIGLAVSPVPRERFAQAQRHLGSVGFYGPDRPTEISPDALVDAAAVVAPRNVRIGPGCVVEAGAVVQEGAILDEEVVVRAGAVVGADGFHPVPAGGGLVNLAHHGTARLRRGVQVLAGSVVCRATFDRPTDVGEHSVVGPLAYVAHGVTIGARGRIAAGARLAGSSRFGDDVYVGPNAVVSNGVRVGDGARISLGAVVVRDVPAGQTVTGNFAVEHHRFLAGWSRFFR